MITEDYVSFETAKLLKEKGFDVSCYSYYMTTKTLHTTFHNRVHVEEEPFFNSIGIDGLYEVKDKTLLEDVCSAPTHQMALKWLREMHRIETHIVLSELNADNSRKYMFYIYSSDINRDFDNVLKEGFNSYEQAVEAALDYVLKNLI